MYLTVIENVLLPFTYLECFSAMLLGPKKFLTDVFSSALFLFLCDCLTSFRCFLGSVYSVSISLCLLLLYWYLIDISLSFQFFNLHVLMCLLQLTCNRIFLTPFVRFSLSIHEWSSRTFITSSDLLNFYFLLVFCFLVISRQHFSLFHSFLINFILLNWSFS